MFKNLKEKLKGWIKKTSAETEEVVEKPAKKVGAKKKKAPVKGTKCKPKRKEAAGKKQPAKKKERFKEKPAEKQVVEEEVPKKEKSFIQKVFTKKEVAPGAGEKEGVVEEPETKKSKKSFFRKTLSQEKFDEIFEELEMILLQNNVAIDAVENLKESLSEKLVGESAKQNIEEALEESIGELLQNPPNFVDQVKNGLKEKKPYVILLMGINGSGKTTSIAKLTSLLKKNKLSVCLAAADTFRAASIEQLQVHADKLDVPLVKKDYGSDPASVGFDAVAYAKKNNVDVVLIDTAGRMNNRDSLMKEIEKIARVNSPDLKIFLGESITGNDATTQAKDFNDAVEIDGIILSKADVDEKGGTAVSVSYVTKKPIYFLGTGQTYDDLEVFDKEKLLRVMFGED